MRNYLKPTIKIARVCDAHHILGSSQESQTNGPSTITDIPGVNFDDETTNSSKKLDMSFWEEE